MYCRFVRPPVSALHICTWIKRAPRFRANKALDFLLALLKCVFEIQFNMYAGNFTPHWCACVCVCTSTCYISSMHLLVVLFSFSSCELIFSHLHRLRLMSPLIAVTNSCSMPSFSSLLIGFSFNFAFIRNGIRKGFSVANTARKKNINNNIQPNRCRLWTSG